MTYFEMLRVFDHAFLNQKLYFKYVYILHILTFSKILFCNRNKYACFPINVPDGDSEFSGKSCMNMVRHAAAVPLDCNSGKLLYVRKAVWSSNYPSDLH